MRKSELINQIADKTGLPKVDVLVIVEQCFREIKDTLAKGDSVFIRGFGSFVAKTRAKKVGRDIKNNTAIEIPESQVPIFRPAKEFIECVKQGTISSYADDDD
jgi:DNA-binding protein HU-beta